MINRIVLTTWLVIAGTVLFMGTWTILDLAQENVGGLSSLLGARVEFSRGMPCLMITAIGIGMHFHRGYKLPLLLSRQHRKVE